MNGIKKFVSLTCKVSLTLFSVVLVLGFTNSSADEKQSKTQSHILSTAPVEFISLDSLFVLGVVESENKAKSYAWISYNSGKPKAYNIGQRIDIFPEIFLRKILDDKIVFEYNQKLVEKKISGDMISNLKITDKDSFGEEEGEEDSLVIENTVLVDNATIQLFDGNSKVGEEEEGKEREEKNSETVVDSPDAIVYQDIQKRDAFIPSSFNEEETEE
ncbi:MAG: hypothetical protein ACC707_19355 [Thiohalomonadales bacterium]